MNEEGTLMKSLKASFMCPLCANMVDSPKWIPLCGHFFCEHCIYASLVKANECPTCSIPAGPNDVKPFLQLRNLLSSFAHINRNHNEQEGIVVTDIYADKPGFSSDAVIVDGSDTADNRGDNTTTNNNNNNDDDDNNGEEKVSMSVQEAFTSDVVDHEDDNADVEIFDSFYNDEQNNNDNGEGESGDVEVVSSHQSKMETLRSHHQSLGEGITVLPDTYQDRFVPDHFVLLSTSQAADEVNEDTNTVHPQVDSFEVPGTSISAETTLGKRTSREETQMEESLNATNPFLNLDVSESATKDGCREDGIVIATSRRQKDVEEETPDLIQNQVPLPERVMDLAVKDLDKNHHVNLDVNLGHIAAKRGETASLMQDVSSESNKNNDDSVSKTEARDENTAPSTMGGSTMGLLADSSDSDHHHSTLVASAKTTVNFKGGSQSPSTQGSDKHFSKTSPNNFQLSGSEGEVARNLKRTISQLKKDLNRLAKDKDKEGKRHKGSRGGKKSSNKAVVVNKSKDEKDSTMDSTSLERVVDNNALQQAEGAGDEPLWIPTVMMSSIDDKTLHVVQDCYKKGWITVTSSDPKDGLVLVMDVSYSGMLLAKRVVPRTKNYLMCVTAGCLVVDSRWLQDSLDAGQLLPLTVTVTPSPIPGGVGTISKWESSALAYIIEGSEQDFARHLSLGGPLRSVVDDTRKASPSGCSSVLQGILVHLLYPHDAATEDVKTREGFRDDEVGIVYPVQRQRVLHMPMRTAATSSIDNGKNGNTNGSVNADAKILEGELRYFLWALGATHWNGLCTTGTSAESGGMGSIGKENSSNARVDSGRSSQTQQKQDVLDIDSFEKPRIHLWCSLSDPLDSINGQMEESVEVPVVSLRWLFDCVSTHTRLPVASYQLQGSSSKLRASSGSKKRSSDLPHSPV